MSKTFVWLTKFPSPLPFSFNKNNIMNISHNTWRLGFYFTSAANLRDICLVLNPLEEFLIARVGNVLCPKLFVLECRESFLSIDGLLLMTASVDTVAESGGLARW